MGLYGLNQEKLRDLLGLSGLNQEKLVDLFGLYGFNQEKLRDSVGLYIYIYIIPRFNRFKMAKKQQKCGFNVGKTIGSTSPNDFTICAGEIETI